jgi:hypothetical protein
VDITPEQAEKLQPIIARYLRFLNRLCQRMDRLSVPPSNDVKMAALKARDATQELHVSCHYATCTSGVGR